MYLENVYLSKTPSWLYWIFPLLFFGFMGVNILFMFVVDVDTMMAQQIDTHGEIQYLLMMLIPFAVMLGGLFLWVKFVHQQPLRALTTTRRKIDWHRIFFSFGLWVAVLLLISGINYMLSPENYQWNFQLFPFLGLFFITLVFIPLQTSFEEYFFRGYLMQAVGIGVGNRWFPLLFTSVMFGLMHIANPEIGKMGYSLLLYYIGTGLFLGIITLMDEGLELALGFHAANNMLMALLVTANWTAFQTPSLFKDMSEPTAAFDIFLPLLVVFPIILIIFARKYGWTHWKEKLTGKMINKQEFLNKIIKD
ncbi:MAG: CPBP family intramembrane metalloprotease [Capnocytophaga sp.]|nr:CPBP family intramembrane metalloprotease [Capnocytophaga sp.]